jgi:hypothetical protein
MLPRVPDFLLTVSQARGRAPYHEGLDPQTLDTKLSKEFGPGWHLVWNIIRKCWCVFRGFPWDPEPIHEFKEGNVGGTMPLTDHIIPKIRNILDLNSNPEKFELARKLGQKENAEREQRQLDDFKAKLVEETIDRLRLQGSVAFPSQSKIIRV